MKIAQGKTPLRGVYIPHFDQISLKNSVLGLLYTLTVAPIGVKFGTEEKLISPQSVQRVPLPIANPFLSFPFLPFT